MVTKLVVEARRRFLWNEILAQGAWAVSAAMGAVILLLLLGTQIIEWHWLILLPSATLGALLWRTLRRMPTAYGIAHQIDARLGLADTLSTAVHFAQPAAAGRVSESVRDAQHARADNLARTLRARDAVPFKMPRAAYAMALLGVTASSLFALRYGLEQRLDLKRPLARILQQALGLDQPQVAALAKKKEPARKPADRGRLEGLPVDQSSLAGQLNATPDSARDTSGAPDASNQKNGLSRDQSRNGLPLAGDSQSASGEGEAGEDASAAENQNQSEPEGRQGSLPSGANGQKNSDDQNGASSSNSSLMSKFRDAMQNLLSRMRPQPGAPGASPQQMSAQSGRPGQSKQAAGNQSGRKGPQSGGQESAAQDGQPGQSSQEANSGRGASRDSEGQSSDKPGSGIGRQDGGKDVKLAEQLAAMGKISEIIGKRSANASGDVTVEVQSNSQQLQTPYSQRAATHSEAGAEINRDEVPVALQAYVQQYFEQVRKQGEAAARVSPEGAAAERRAGPVR